MKTLKIKLFLVSILSFVLIQNNTMQAQNLEWAKSIGGIGNDEGVEIKVDNSDNVYTVGHFTGMIDFDPGPGVFNITPFGNYDVFVSKLDASGNFIWAKQFGGTDEERATSLYIDDFGDVYVTGHFKGTCDFDPSAGVFNLTAVGLFDAFICKLDSSGNFVWAKQFGGTDDEYINSIVVDDSKNVYTTGTFLGTTDFDPGAGTFNFTSFNQWVIDVFVSKLDSLGNFVWAKQIGGTSLEESFSIALDKNNNVYTTGYYWSADFDPGPGTYNLTSNGLEDIFVSKLDKDGNFVWAKSMGGSIDRDRGKSIAVDDLGYVYTTGYYGQSADFDPGPGTYTLAHTHLALFVSKLDSSGNFVWAKQFAGTNGGRSNSISLDNAGNIYTTGYFQGTVDFDPGAGTFNLTELGSDDMFLCKLDSSGSFKWAYQISGSSNREIGESITTDNSGNIYSTGSYQGTADFDPGTGTLNYTSLGAGDFFVHKIGQCISNAQFSYINNGNGNYSFTNTSPGTFQSHWAFGDGNTSTVTNPNHTFASNGIFPVTLTISPSVSGSCFDFFFDSINVIGVLSPAQCVAGFVMFPDTNNNDITVINSSVGNNLTYHWDFGDGDTSNLANPTHTYAGNGPYYLCLTVDDGVSCNDMYCDSIGVNGVVLKQTGFSINVIGGNTSTEINEFDLDGSLLLSPNPADNWIIIDTEHNVASVEIYDYSGRYISSKSINNNRIETSDLANGLYIFKFAVNESLVVKKVVINR